MSSSMTSSNPIFNESILSTSNIVIFGDTLVIFNRKTKYNINRSLNNGSARVKYFLEATSKDLLQYVDTTSQDNLFEIAVIHIGINDFVNNKNSLNIDHVLENIKNNAWKCKRYGIQKVLISGLLTTNRLEQAVIEKVYKLIFYMCNIFMCNIDGYCYVNTDNITRGNLFKDGLHLLDTGKQILASNFVFNVNTNVLMSCTFHPNVHLTAV